jgi:hypothetical protein
VAQTANFRSLEDFGSFFVSRFRISEDQKSEAQDQGSEREQRNPL